MPHARLAMFNTGRHLNKNINIMVRLFLTTIISLFVLVSSGQNKANKYSLNVNDPLIKVTLLGTGTPQPIMDRLGNLKKSKSRLFRTTNHGRGFNEFFN